MSDQAAVGKELINLGKAIIRLTEEYLKATEKEDKMEIDFEQLREQLIQMYKASGFNNEQANLIVNRRIAELKAEYSNG